jgi:hypothetical protein
MQLSLRAPLQEHGQAHYPLHLHGSSGDGYPLPRSRGIDSAPDSMPIFSLKAALNEQNSGKYGTLKQSIGRWEVRY